MGEGTFRDSEPKRQLTRRSFRLIKSEVNDSLPDLVGEPLSPALRNFTVSNFLHPA